MRQTKAKFRLLSDFSPLLFALVFLFFSSALFAETEIALQISSLPEAKLSFTQSFVFPFLRGEGPLTAENNLKAAFSAEVSPVSVNGKAEFTLTPIAFFQLVAGGFIGSGWNMVLGNGIGFNEPVGTPGGLPRESEISGTPFEGLFWDLHTGAALQFDLAAIFPGDWNHLVFRTYHEGRYRAFTNADSGDSWVYETATENRNGFRYYGNFLLGYQMPASPLLNTVGLLAEMDLFLFDTPNGADWGDDLPVWYVSALFNFTITKQFSLALIFQTQTFRNYADGDLLNKNGYFYQDRIIDKDDPYRLMFYRAAAIMTMKI
ncbi:hypothetical protein AGMMS49928_20750 [Spirochaetia bacterium]|nr:hypothetical protein AGMMS49928_20750 [Spirochaetia bacterium]